MKGAMATQAYHLKVESDEDGVFVGTVPELPGCVSPAETEAELLANMEEAVLLYLETRDAGQELPRSKEEGPLQTQSDAGNISL